MAGSGEGEPAGLRERDQLEDVVVRFAGDSGDGVQLTGDRFTDASGLFGNDFLTSPNFPAEIRAPAGTVPGVSAFQVRISHHEVLTPGDAASVLVVMNPAALRKEIAGLTPGGTLIVNGDAFDERALAKAGYASNPLSDGSLTAYTVYEVPMTSLTLEATRPAGAKPRDRERSKNFFALGLVSWLYGRPVDATIGWIDTHFAAKPEVKKSNLLAFHAGWNFGETAELFDRTYEVERARFEPGTYTNVSGNTALAWGLVAAGQLAGIPMFLASYPITPASDLLHELAKHKNFGVCTIQAEDEIGAAAAALGAAFGGHLAVTTTSGPGLDLKLETLGLAVSLELPMVVVDVQRGGPSTGLPTKSEQSDLLAALYGRHGEAPLPVVAASAPSHCFWAAIEAVRIALKYRTPVILLSDGHLATSSEPWRLPALDQLPDISVEFASELNGGDRFLPYLRDPVTLARPWAIPGTPGLEHCIGGLEKEDGTGVISYDADNHERMVRLRAAKIAGIANDLPPVEVDEQAGADTLVLGWGSSRGAIASAVRAQRAEGRRVASAHLVHLNPFPPNLGSVLRSYHKVLVAEMNLGHLARLVRSEFLVDARTYCKVQGVLRTDELAAALGALIDE